MFFDPDLKFYTEEKIVEDFEPLQLELLPDEFDANTASELDNKYQFDYSSSNAEEVLKTFRSNLTTSINPEHCMGAEYTKVSFLNLRIIFYMDYHIECISGKTHYKDTCIYTLKEFTDRLHHLIHNMRKLIIQQGDGVPPKRFNQDNQQNADYTAWATWVAANFEENINRFSFASWERPNGMDNQGWNADEQYNYQTGDVILSRKPDGLESRTYRISIEEVVPGRGSVNIDPMVKNDKNLPFDYGRLICAVNWKKNFRVDGRYEARIFVLKIILD